MAGAAPRDFLITYGTFSVGTGTARQIHGPIRAQRTHEELEIEFSFVTTAATPAAFATEISAVEEAFRTPNQLLKVTGGDTQTNALWYDFHPTGAGGADVGFDSAPEIVKEQDEYSSGLSRRYTVRIRLGLPANKLGSSDGQSGRRECSVTLEYEPSRRRRVTISGTYTAVGSTPARDQYEAQIDAYALAVLTDIDASHSAGDPVFELVGEPVVEAVDVGSLGDRGAGFLCVFVRVYRELIFRQTEGAGANTFDDPEIKEQRLSIVRVRPQPVSGTIGTARDRAEVSYSCEIDKTLKSGLSDLRDKWEQDIRSFVIQQAKDLLGGGQKKDSKEDPLIQVEEPEFHLDENRITARMTLGGFEPGPVEFGTFAIRDSIETGQKVVPLLDLTNASRKFVFQGPTRTVRVVERRVRTSRSAVPDFGAPFGVPFEGFDIPGAAGGLGLGGGGGGQIPDDVDLPDIQFGSRWAVLRVDTDQEQVRRNILDDEPGFGQAFIDQVDRVEAELVA